MHDKQSKHAAPCVYYNRTAGSGLRRAGGSSSGGGGGDDGGDEADVDLAEIVRRRFRVDFERFPFWDPTLLGCYKRL